MSKETNTKTATKNNISPVRETKKTYRSYLKLSIRRKHNEPTLPGDDAVNQNPKIGSSLKGKAPLSGLSLEEEKRYLPEIIGVSPDDVNWRKEVKEYWNNISERVPHDDESSPRDLPGKVIEFNITFDNEKDKKAFDNAEDFDKKAEVSKRGEIDIANVPDYVLFRYCIVYGRVANNFKDRYKSNKILFYLYSKEKSVKQEHNSFMIRNQARTLFMNILEDIKRIDAIIVLYGNNPHDEFKFEGVEDKHLFLEEKINKKPKVFLQYAKDKNLLSKSMIAQAVEKGIIYRVSNTEKHYFGEDKEILLGKNLEETVLYLKSNDTKNKQIRETIEAQLKYN